MTGLRMTNGSIFGRRGRKSRGFTLVELIVVLTIIALLAAVGVATALGFINRSKFDQNSQNAITVYQTAQSVLSEKSMNGTMDEWVTGLAAFKGQLFDPTLEAKLLEDQETNHSINKTIALTYNPKSANNSEDKYLYELLRGSFYDMTVFNGTMAVELDISATYGNGKINYSARVLSAFYSRENDIASGWDEIRKGDGYVKDDPELKDLPQAKGSEGYAYRRRTSFVGWFNGTSESITAPSGVLPVFLPQSKVQPLEGHIVAGEHSGYLFNLRNGETLDVSWAIFDYDGIARKNHNEDIVITLNSAENGHDTTVIRGNDISDSKFYDGVQICISPAALNDFLSSIENNPSTTVKENVNGIYDITRTSQDGFIKAKVVRTENNVEKTYTDKYFPLTVTLVKGDGRKGTARDKDENLADYYEFRLSLDAMMVRADETTSDPGWNHYGIDRLFGYTRQDDINRLNPRNIYATLHGSWNSFKANGSYDYVTVDPFDPTEAARAIDDPVYLTNVRQTNGVMTYIYYVEFNSGLGRYDELDSTNSENGNVITGRCVVNSLFGDLNYSNSYDPADADAISGTFWSSSGGNAVITSYRHLYNIRKVFAEKTATFRIAKNLDWYVHDTVMINGTITELYTSEVKVFSQGTAGYKSPVEANQLKVVSFPALRELKAKHTLTSVSDTSKKTYWINNVQMRGISFRGSDNAYGFICINNGTVYNLYTNNLNLVMKDVPDGSTSDYDLINPDGNVTFDTSANLFYNGSTDKPLGGLIGKSTGKIGVDGIESRYNTVQMCNTVVMGGNYWNGANHSRVAALVAFCENNDANATDIYGVLALKGSFYIVNGGTRTGGLIADNFTNVAAKLIVDGSPVSQDNEFNNKPVETHSGKPVSCFIGGRGYVGSAFAWSNNRALSYGTAIKADDISYDTTTGKLSFPDMENNFQIDVDLPESSLILQSSLFDTWKDPCGIGGAIGLAYQYSGDYINIRVNNEGDILSLEGMAHNNGCGGAVGYFRSVPNAKNVYIEVNNGTGSHVGSINVTAPKYTGGAIGYTDGSLNNSCFVLNVTNDGAINAEGNGDYQGVGGAIGAAGSNYVGRSLINVVNKKNSSIVWQGSDKNSGYGAGGAIGSLGKVFNDKANPSESNLITSDSVIYVNNAGSISGASNVGGAIGFAPRNDGRIYTENSGTIEGTGGIGFVGGSVGRMLFAQRGTIQSILNGATIIGSDFVGGAAGRILNFRMDVSDPAAVVRTVVNGNSTVKSDSGSIVGGVVGDLFVQGNGKAGSVELAGHSSVPKLTVYGWDAVGGNVGAYRSDSGNYPQVVMPDQAVTNRLIVDVDGDDYVGGAVGLLRPSSDYSNSTSNVINLNLKTADISIVIDEVLHPQSSIVGSGVDVGGAIGYISSAQKMFKGRISVSSIAGDNSGGSLISGSRNVGGAIGCDLLSCPYLAEGSSDNYGIIVDFSTSPWKIEATVSSDSEANVGGAVGYFNNGSNGDETSTYITNIQYYSKTGYNEKQSGYRNNVFPITVNMGSSSVIADGRNVGGAIGKSLIRTGNISVNDFSGTVSGKSNIGGAVGLNRADFNNITVTILGSGTVTGGTDSDINHDDLASPVDYDGSNVGGAVGYNISRAGVGITVYVSGTIEGYGRNVGGAIGFCHFSESKTFINEIKVYLLGNSRVIGHSSNVGGSLGYTLGNIHYVTTEIRGTSQIIGDQRVGGVIGFASAKLKNISTLEGEYGSTVRDSQVGGYVESATAVISADYAIKGTKLIGGVIGESGFKRYMSYGGATRNAYTSPYFGEVKAVINSASVFSPDTGTDSNDDVMAGGIIGHLTDGMVDNVVLGGTGGVVHVDTPNRSFANSVLVKANGRAVGGLVGQIGYDELQQNVFLSKVTIEDNAPYLCVVSGNGSDMIGGWIGSANGSGGGIGKRNNVNGYNGNNRSSYEVNNVRVVYSEGSYVGGLCGRMDLKSRNQNGSAGERYINADVTINLDGAYILGKSAVGAVAGGIGYGRWDTGSITINMNNYTNIGDINNKIPGDGNNYTPICYEAGGAFGYVYYDSFGFDGNKYTFSVPITLNIDSTSGISGLAGSGDPDTNSNVGVGGAFGTFKGLLNKNCFVNVNTDNSVVSVYSKHTNVGGAFGVWVDGKTVGSDATKIYISTNASVETAGANACAGGFAGRILNTLSNSSIQLARADGIVTASGNNGRAGGFVGNLDAGTVKLCFTTSIVSNTAGYSTGGFVGTANAGTVSNCYVGGHTYDGQYVAGESNVTGKDNVGGFVGETTGNVSFTQCYSTASVLGTGNGVGGFIGNMANNGKITTTYCTGRVINSSGNYGSTGAFAGSVAAVDGNRFGDGNNKSKVLDFVNDPAMRLVGSVNGTAVDENTYKSRVCTSDYNGIHGDNTYTGYPFDKGLLDPANPDVITTVYPLRAFINNTHYGDWPLPSSDGVSLDSSSVSIALNVPTGVEYQQSGNKLPENSLVITYTNPETQQSLQLKEGTHYTLSYADNINVGTAKVYISAVDGSGFKGSVVKTFEITPVNLSAAKVVLINNEYYFTGAPIDLTNGDLTVTLERADGKIETLETPKDYYITYAHKKDGDGEHTGIGTVTGTIHGTNNYTGYAAATFTFNIIGTDISNIADVQLIYNSNIYTGSAIIPEVSVRVNGERLVQAADNDPNNPGDYILTYENCVNVGTGTAKVTVTGINNYSGDVLKTFDILPATDTWKTAPAIADWTYGSPSDPVGEATSGYPITYKYYLDSSLQTLTTPENSGASEEGGKPSNVGSYYLQFSVEQVANDNSSEDVKCYNYTALDPVVKNFTISKADISGATVTFGSSQYHGHVGDYVAPTDITVSLNGTDHDLENGRDFEVIYPESTAEPGLYSITIKGIGNYEGTIDGSTYEIVRYYYVVFVTGEEGVEIESLDLPAGGVINEPANPREGYSVVWYMDEAKLYPYTFGGEIDKDIMLYAEWTKLDDTDPNTGNDDPNDPQAGGNEDPNDPQPGGNEDPNDPNTGNEDPNNQPDP